MHIVVSHWLLPLSIEIETLYWDAFYFLNHRLQDEAFLCCINKSIYSKNMFLVICYITFFTCNMCCCWICMSSILLSTNIQISCVYCIHPYHITTLINQLSGATMRRYYQLFISKISFVALYLRLSFIVLLLFDYVII